LARSHRSADCRSSADPERRFTRRAARRWRRREAG
jgi:hypothetical protein